MAINHDELAVFAGAVVYTAPLGTAAPSDHQNALDPAWIHLGEISEDGIEFSTSPSFNAIRGYNSPVPVRYAFESDEHTVGFTLIQWSGEGLKFVYGGGEVTQVAAVPGDTPPVEAHAVFTPPTDGNERVNYKSLLLELADGTGALRRVIPKGLVTDGGGWSSDKTDGAGFATTFSIVPAAGEAPWYDLTNLPGIYTGA